MNPPHPERTQSGSCCPASTVLLGLVLVAGAGILGFGLWRTWRTEAAETAVAPPVAAGPAAPDAETAGTFLEAFGTNTEADSEPRGAVLSDEALEKRFGELLALEDRLRGIGAQTGAAGAEKLEELQRTHEQVMTLFNQGLALFEKEVARARKDRPDAAIPAWLTGELLLLIRGEPEEILPHLQRAHAAGLARSRLLASMARAQIEANAFDEALRSATRALELAPQDRDAWDVFVRVGFNSERFAEVLARIDRTFAASPPAWAAEVRAEAAARLADWQDEQKRRAADARANNLPRVRLLVEHRRFARGELGTPLTTVETSGKGEVVVELFEDQAPAAVASFLTLVAQKKYDGTRFYLAEAATLVAGGDVQSRQRDAKDDGKGNPGYFLPDEFERKDARSHYRGALSLVNSGPGTSGSQFFITLVPMPEMDGQYTVFGRVIQGQDVVERITRGRTNPDVGRYGRIIPGDLLVEAQVLRQRNHEYRVPKVE
jgi:peptidyl-prolyl cis-trans isomerase B (cyclophilin B)